MSRGEAYDGTAPLQAQTTANGGVISLQAARLIENTSADNFTNGHDYGYGMQIASGDVGDPDGWLGSDGKGGGTFRVLNSDAISSASEEASFLNLGMLL